MVQIGNIHIGKAETALPPTVDSGEAFLMWDYLVSRYDNIQVTQLFQNFAHDPDLKLLLKTGLTRLENQINQVEVEMNRVKIPLPSRPPKTDVGSGVWSDEFIFKIVFTEMQSFLDQHTRTIRSLITNDALRMLFVKFINEELEFFNNMCKYGKMKGWFSNPPMLTVH